MYDFLIIGGGVIGMLTARELNAAGAKVCLLEKGRLGGEASWAGGGILSPLYPWRYAAAVTALAGWSQRHYPELARELADETGIDPEWTQNGLLVIDGEDHADALDWGKRTGNPVTRIERRDVANLEPALSDIPPTALWLQEVAQIRNPRLVKALLASLDRSGVAIREHTEVRKLRITDLRITGVETDGGFLAAGRAIVCAGAWSAQLLAGLDATPEIKPVHGQMLLYAAKPGLVTRIVLNASRYAIPRRDGHVLFGSTIEDIGFTKHTTTLVRDELHATALAMFPSLAGFPVERHWSGLRPGSPGGVPYIGRHPEIRGLYLNSGHFRNGVVLAPASARLLADMVLQRPPIVPPDPYAWDAPRPAWELP